MSRGMGEDFGGLYLYSEVFTAVWSEVRKVIGNWGSVIDLVGRRTER